MFSLTDLKKVEDIAQNAGAIIMDIRRHGFDVSVKQDGSPVTLADSSAQKYIQKNLYTLYPEIPFVAEESFAPAPLNSIYWLVDPLDGTFEYINQRDEFTVNIALMVNGRPFAGVVYAPAKNVIYSGMVRAELVCNTDMVFEGAAYKNGEKLLFCTQKRDKLAAAISRSHPSSQEQDFLSGFENIELIKTGSSIKFCLLAEGTCDIYPRYGKTMYWDIAAGDAVLSAAGGRVCAWGTVKAVSYVNRDMQTPPFIAYRKDMPARIF